MQTAKCFATLLIISSCRKVSFAFCSNFIDIYTEDSLDGVSPKEELISESDQSDESDSGSFFATFSVESSEDSADLSEELGNWALQNGITSTVGEISFYPC